MAILIKRLDAALGQIMRWFCVAAFTALTALVGAVVFIRFFPVAKLSWSDEIIEWLMASLIFVAAAALWRERDHFRIEAMADAIGGSVFGRLFYLVIEILTAAFITLFAVYSLDLTLSVGRTSPILSWPMTWWYATMPIAGFIMLVYSVRNVIACFRSLVSGIRDRHLAGGEQLALNQGKESPMTYAANSKSKYVYTIKDIPLVPLTAESSTRFVAADGCLMSFIENPPGTEFPLHKHEAVQILIILEGSEEHVCGDETFFMEAGDVCIHPSNAIHGGKTSTGFKGIDIFIPPREDYLELMAKHGLPTKPAV